MKKLSAMVISLLLLVSLSIALDARIDESQSGQSTVDVVLKPSNNYSYTPNYSSTTSTGDIKNREWTLVGTDQTDSGVAAQFKFDRGMDDPENIKLVASDGDTADDFQISQPVQDIPNASISADTRTVVKGDSVEFDSIVRNEFKDGNLTYSWNWDGTGSIGDGTSNFTHTFDSTGTYDINLTVSDDAGSSTTGSTTINVNSPEEEEPEEGGTEPGGDGISLRSTDNNETSQTDKSSKKSSDNSKDNRNKTKTRPEDAGKSVKKVKAKAENGVAKVNITKGDEVNEISVSVNPASDRAPVKKIRITSGESGQVIVSVRNAGKNKPQEVPEPASEDEGDVYNYQEINTSINDSEVDLAEIDFSVNKSWVDERNRSKDDVVMKRFNNNNWKSLETRYLNETDDQYNFEASSEGFSYYAVALEDDSGSRTDEVNSSVDVPVYVLALIFGFVLVLLVFYLWKFRSSEDQI
jgi:PGF-pre-PGF domain-containing protein